MGLPYGRITGKNVVASGISTLGHIEMEREATSGPVFASNTGGGADRGEGNLRLAGNFWAWGHTPPAGVFPGSTFALAFTITGATSGLNGEVATVTAVMCTELEIVVLPYDPQQKNRVYYIAHFGPAGYDMTIATSAVPTDVASPSFYSTKGLGCTLNSVAQDGVQEMHLAFRNLANEEIDSTYNGIWYVPPGNLDWQFTYRRSNSAIGDIPIRNTIYTLGMQVETAKTWALPYGRVMGDKAVYDRESEKVIATDIVIAKCMSGANKGSVTDPAGTVLWQ